MGPFSSPFSSLARYLFALERHGFSMLGEGCYGYVYAKPGSPWVLKVGEEPSDGWPVYAAMVLERHPSNPFAPRIKSLRWHGEEDQRFYVAVMERLDLTVEWLSFRDPRFSAYQAAREAVYESPDDGVSALSRAYLREHPELARLTADIRERLLPLGFADLHQGNAMTRKGDDEHIVITDPLGSSSEPLVPSGRRLPGQLQLPF